MVILFVFSDLLPIALTSALISTIATILGGFLMKSMEHKYEYQKHILVKRIEVYDSLESLFKTFATELRFVQPEQKIVYGHHHAIFHSQSNFLIFQNEVATLINKGFWLSDEILKILKKVKLVLDTIGSADSPHCQIDNPDGSGIIHNLGCDSYKEVQALYNMLKEQYLDDLKTLDSLKEFKKKKSSL